ncbi:allophanate hydrolase [Paenibacillus arenilitoris]|uniref:allophanate hydrolase n=1 Tax=Paenibacillus arenilitoris TaxID=2772299 RepID=UPI001CC25F7D|nr:allophanate hydrolase [Paenibacillus arenilitoris]
MNKVELPAVLTVEGLRELYRSGEASPLEVVEEIIRRSRADEGMNIWITPPELPRIEPYLRGLDVLNRDDAPLWGIPFAVKDNIDWSAAPTTAACPAFAYEPAADAAVVERLIAAGAIPVGKTNLDQFATGLVGTRSPYGETHNALRPELISGGSSSGSAVAVARGQAAFALGTDTAGSGRVPALLNGLVGYKPSLGAWPVRGVVPACESLDCVTVFAAELGGALAVDRVARGAHADDPWSRELPASGSAMPARICVPAAGTLAFYGPFAKAYEAAWERSVDRLNRLGAAVEETDISIYSEAASLLYEGPYVAERWAGLGAFVEGNEGAALAVTERILRSGVEASHTAASLFRAMHRLQALKREARKRLEGAVLAMPTAGGTWTREQVRADPIVTNSAMGRYTNHCNLLDLCAVAVPAGEAAEALPFGITLFAAAEREDLIRGAAQAFLNSDGVESTLQ